MLGSLKPKLLVVTTPNREYNPVLQHLGNSLIPPNNTRNSDHRFEWYSPVPYTLLNDRAIVAQLISISLQSQGCTAAQDRIAVGASMAGP